MSSLFTPTIVAGMNLKNRVVMAPMTRSRAIGNVPNELMAKYYAQRAEAGLIITEGTSPSPDGLGYPRIPGLFNQNQVNGWKLVTEAVHAKGAKIFIQLMHSGRVGHPLNIPAGGKLLAPSALAAPGQMWTDQQGQKDHPVPAEMTEAEIHKAIDEYAHSAELAMQAGFDGVEIHAANGYLIEQLLNTASNHRKDQWGSATIENRARFALEVAKKVSKAIGAKKTGIRVSPFGVFNGMQADAKTEELYTYLAHELSQLGLAYIHVVDHSGMGAPEVPKSVKAKIRDHFKGAYILSGNYDRLRADADLAQGKGELVAFGRPFLANPDLVSKLQSGAALKAPDQSTFYTPGEKGYTDYR